MTLIVSVLAVLALLVGTALGTFRHRQYGVWGFFGVLLAMLVADSAGPALGLYLAGVVAGDVATVVYLVRMLILLLVAGVFAYYCDDLIPEAQDPKTRQDNILAGILGFVNTYLLVAYLIRALGGLGTKGNEIIVGSGLNQTLVLLLPWMTATIFVVIFGWSSVRKVMRAIAKLRGVSANTPPARPASTTSPSGFTPSPYGSAYSTPTTTTTTTPVVAKPSAWSRLTGWMSRPKEDAAPTSPPNNLSNNGITPPHGISGLTGASPYSSQTPGYGNTGLTGGNTYASSSSGYGSTGTTSGYGSTGTTSGTTYSSPASGYSPTGMTGSFGATPPSNSSGAYSSPPASSSGTGDSKLASSIFGPVTPVYSQPSFGSNMNSGATNNPKNDDNDDDDDGYYYDDEDTNNNPPPFRG
jgi:hypothetical protein